MRRVDALAFLCTAAAVLLVNAVLAVGIGCSLYLLRHLYQKLIASKETANLAAVQSVR